MISSGAKSFLCPKIDKPNFIILLYLLSNFCKFSVRSRGGQVMGRQDSYEDMDEPLLMRGQEHQVIMVGFPEVGLLAEPCL